MLSGEPWANPGHFNYKKVRKTRRGKFVMCISVPKTPSRKRLARARRNRPHDALVQSGKPLIADSLEHHWSSQLREDPLEGAAAPAFGETAPLRPGLQLLPS